MIFFSFFFELEVFPRRRFGVLRDFFCLVCGRLVGEGVAGLSSLPENFQSARLPLTSSLDSGSFFRAGGGEATEAASVSIAAPSGASAAADADGVPPVRDPVYPGGHLVVPELYNLKSKFARSHADRPDVVRSQMGCTRFLAAFHPALMLSQKEQDYHV